MHYEMKLVYTGLLVDEGTSKLYREIRTNADTECDIQLHTHPLPNQILTWPTTKYSKVN
jgi:hypothetical protein